MATRTDQIPPENTSEEGNNPQNGTPPENSTMGTNNQPAGTDSIQTGDLQAELDKLRRQNELLTATVRDQGRALNRVADQTGDAGGRGKPPEVQAPVVDPKEFWADPGKALEVMLEHAVAPLKEEIRKTKREVTAPNDRERARQSLPHFVEIEYAIDNMLRQQGIDPTTATYDELDSVHAMAYGYAVREGIIKPSSAPQNQPTNRGGDPVSTEQNNRPNNPAPPQHRPSPAPLPAGQSNQPKLRELTENEARICREQFAGNKEAYLKWLDMDEEEVAISTYGQEQK